MDESGHPKEKTSAEELAAMIHADLSRMGRLSPTRGFSNGLRHSVESNAHIRRRCWSRSQ